MSQPEDVAKKYMAQLEEFVQKSLAEMEDVATKNIAQLKDAGKENLAQREDGLQSKSLTEVISSQRANLSKDVIAYLSKEIETVTNGMMVFRSKVSFSLIVGPFVNLGTLLYAAKGISINTKLGVSAWIAIVTVLCRYLALMFLSGKIEEDGWRQCNTWRRLISDLQKDPTMEINNQNVRTDKFGVDPVAWMKWSVLLAGFLMLISFGMLLFILTQVQSTPTVTP